MMHRSLARLARLGLAVGGFVFAPSVAHAAASARLVYMRGTGAEGCPGEEAVRAAVSMRLGYDPFYAWSRDTLFVGITHRGGAFHLEIRLIDDASRQRGSRDIAVKGDACPDVIDALGLSISLVINPASVAGLVASDELSGSTPPAAPSPPATPSSAQAPLLPPSDPNALAQALRAGTVPDTLAPFAAAKPPRSVSTHVGVGLLGSVGSSPALAAGGVLFVGVRWRQLSLDLEGRADLPATGASELTGVSARSWLVVGSLVPCVNWRFAFGCPLASFGAIGATSRGVPVTTEQYAPWLGVGGRAGVELALSTTVLLRTYGELVRTLTQHELYVDSDRAYRFGPWSGGLGLAIVWPLS